MNRELNKKNYIIYAMKHYENPSCQSLEEFYNDLNCIKYIKRLLNRYVRNKSLLKERLLLNHFIVFYNVFYPEAATKLLFLKLDEKFYPQIKTFLTFLNYMPDIVYISNEKIIHNTDIPVDNTIANKLRNI